jgi:glycerol-3-phosphate dehydrogenase
MLRSLKQLSDDTFDVLVVGGGASGAAVAREAAIRGFKTALLERDDFGAGTSAHCFKVVHGGIRYIQHGDIRRMRASCRERSVLLRIAPHLVSPLPFVIPTFGQGLGSKWFLGTGMVLYDLLTRDCNALVDDPGRRIGSTRFLSRSETLQLFPEIDTRGLTGANVFEDGQMYNPPRLVLGFATAAAKLGASIANYVEVERLLLDGKRVIGAVAHDRLTGERADIRARMVINAAGPWAEGVLQPDAAVSLPNGTYSRDACFVVARRSKARMALALQGRTRDADALLARKGRHMFLVPWREFSLIGVWHRVVDRDPDHVGLSNEELREFIAEINACYPALRLGEDEVSMTGFGLVPFGDASRQKEGGLSFGKQSRLVDHRVSNGVEGLVSLISVRYTVARKDAVAALDMATRQLGQRGDGKESEQQPLPGGDIANFAAFQAQLAAQWPRWLPTDSHEGLAQNYGTKLQEIFALGQRDSALQRCLSGSRVSHAEVVHAMREEMAERMADIVFRRTDLGTAAHPGAAALDELQSLMQRERGWSAARTVEERALVESHLRRYHAANPRSGATAQRLAS